MKRFNLILFQAIFFLYGLNAQEQTALNFNRSTPYQSVFKGTTFAAFKGNSFSNLNSSSGSTPVKNSFFPGECKAQITVPKDQGTILCNLISEDKISELVKTGNEVPGAWGPTSIGECKYCFRSEVRYRNVSRTDVYQDKHVCTYVPHAAWIGWVGTATATHLHGARYNKTVSWVEEDISTSWCCWWSALIPDLDNTIETVSPGRVVYANYAGEKPKVMLGSKLSINEDMNLPSQVASVKYEMDGIDWTPGQTILMNSEGSHSLRGEINTKSGGIVKFTIPFTVIKQVSIEEITQKSLNNGEKEINIKIVNNDMVNSSAGWVSTSLLNNPGYAIDIQGSKHYDLTKGGSTIINILLHPSDIYFKDPAKPETPLSFDFNLSNSPAANGLILDKKTVTTQTAAITNSGGIIGNDGPQQVRTLSVKTIEGEVVDIKVPNNIRPGDHISGSIIATRSSSTLEGAVIDINGQQHQLKGKNFTFLVPAGIAAIPFIIKDKNGAELTRTNIPINVPNLPTPGNNVTVPPQQIEMPPQHSPGNFVPMNYCQPGQPLTINGNFDGNAANTKVSINNIPCEVLAESDRGSFVNVPSDLPAGKASITMQEGGVTQTMPIQVITTDLKANKTVVLKGTQAKVTATVKGLENLDLDNYNNYKIEITNGSPGIIQFRDANTTTITRDINSSNVKNGTFTFTADIIGTATGSYTINSNLTSNTGLSCWKQYENCIANCEAQEKKCYDDCDKGNKGIGCYLACSLAARVCEAECFRAYLQCLDKALRNH